MVIKESGVDPVCDTIIGTSGTDEVGDGKIFISLIDEVICVRTGKRGEDAI